MSTLTLLLTLALAPQPAPADEAPTHADADQAALQGEEGGLSVYKFEGDTLTGDVLSPDGKLVQYRRPPHQPSLINLRPHFLPELVWLSLDL